MDINELRNDLTGSNAIDGNAAGNFVDISSFLTGLVWNPGERLALRWLDSDEQGNDAGMSIDNFSFTVVPEPGTFVLCGAVLALAGLGIRRRRESAV